MRWKVWTTRVVMLVVALLVLAMAGIWLFLRASLPQLDGTVHVSGMKGPVSVARDERGVPLISGLDRLDVAYATGFVHAQERYFQMDLLRRVGAGELAELFGEKAVSVDQQRRLHRFRARAEKMLAAMRPEERALIDRYVSGVNDGLHALNARPFEYALIGVNPRQWAPADSLLVVFAMYFDLQGSREAHTLARGWLREHTTPEQLAFLLPEATQWDVPLDAAHFDLGEAAIPEYAPAWWGRQTEVKMASADFADNVGSNNWAVAGSRSATGGAIVSDDMHLGISLPNTWYRAALQFNDGRGKQRRVVGLMLPGAPPLIVVGSNGHVAWGFTNSYGNYLDMIEVDPKAAVTQANETILVKGRQPVVMTVRETAMGPLREVGGKTYALHWVAHDPAALNLRAQELETADTLEQALAVANGMGIPEQNFVAGDAQGNIGWTIAGPLPRRAQAGMAATFPQQGDSPTLWNGFLAPDEYPRVVNPDSGQISTANSRQLAGTGAQLIGDGGFDLGARHHQVEDDLAKLGPRTDVHAVYGVSLDDRAVFLAPWRERAMRALDPQAVNGNSQRVEFLKLLQTGWTGRASADSVAYRLTREFMWAMGDILFAGANAELKLMDDKATVASATSRWPVVLGRLMDAQPAGWLPSNYKNWQAVELAAIDKVIADLAKDGTPLSAATWGARNTANIAHPISGAVPALKPWLAAPPDVLPGDSNMPRVAGPKFGQSERMTVTPGKEEEGVFNMPGGQSGHPLSPYFLAGHHDWVEGKPTPLLPGAPKHTLILSP